jgi:hypothetical protein
VREGAILYDDRGKMRLKVSEVRRNENKKSLSVTPQPIRVGPFQVSTRDVLGRAMFIRPNT